MAEVEVVVAKPEKSCEWSVGFLIGVDGASNPFTPGGDISPGLADPAVERITRNVLDAARK